MAKKKKKIVANGGAKKKASTAKSLTWPQMHTRVSTANQKFLHSLKKTTDKDVIVVLDFMINSFRKSGVKSVAQYFGL
jgi:glutamate-1-semialdehyde aminotransferase